MLLAPERFRERERARRRERERERTRENVRETCEQLSAKKGKNVYGEDTRTVLTTVPTNKQHSTTIIHVLNTHTHTHTHTHRHTHVQAVRHRYHSHNKCIRRDSMTAGVHLEGLEREHNQWHLQCATKQSDLDRLASPTQHLRRQRKRLQGDARGSVSLALAV